MKKYLKFFSLLFFALAILSSCNNDDDEPDLYPTELVKGCYIVNYGNFGSGGASISKYDYDADQLTNQYFKAQNSGLEILSNIQHASIVGDKVYLMENEPDMVVEVDPLFKQTKNGITEEIVKPRYSVSDGEYLYVSCWGGNMWEDESSSYIAKINMGTSSVEKKIELPGGPEGLAIAKGKLYAALNYKDSVAVINLSSEAISYIETPAVTSYFVKDQSNNLYVSLISTYSDFSSETGLGYINTSSDELEVVYNLPGVSTDYASIIAFNNDYSKIYVVASLWEETSPDVWELFGAVSEFDVASKTFASENLISDLSGPKGLTVNPYNGDIYVFAGETVTGAGLMKIYNSNGEFVKEETVGASPTMAIFID